MGGSAEAVSAAEVLWRANGRRGLRAAEQRHSPGGGTAESYKQTRCPGDCSVRAAPASDRSPLARAVRCLRRENVVPSSPSPQGRGNCNGELGTCDCLTGYGGAACQEVRSLHPRSRLEPRGFSLQPGGPHVTTGASVWLAPRRQDLLAACRWGGDFETMCIPPSPSRALPLTCACAEACVKVPRLVAVFRAFDSPVPLSSSPFQRRNPDL